MDATSRAVPARIGGNMSKFDMIKYLIEDAEHETAYLRDYDMELNNIAIKHGISSNEVLQYQWYHRNPSKQRIKDDLTMARRLILKLRKDVE